MAEKGKSRAVVIKTVKSVRGATPVWSHTGGHAVPSVPVVEEALFKTLTVLTGSEAWRG